MMGELVTALADPKGKHDPDRAAVRHGHEQGSVVSAYTFTCRLAYGLTCRSAEVGAPVHLS